MPPIIRQAPLKRDEEIVHAVWKQTEHMSRRLHKMPFEIFYFKGHFHCTKGR